MKPPDTASNDPSRDADELLRSIGIDVPKEEGVSSLSASFERTREGLSRIKGGDLSKGINGRIIGGVVVGIALVGGAVYALTRKKKEPPRPGSWAAHVEAQRAASSIEPARDR